MKKCFLILSVFSLLVSVNSFSQKVETPFSKLGYKKAQIVTLSKGEFQEFHDMEDIVEIGSVYYNTITKEVVGIVGEEKTENAINSSTASMSMDPHCEKYYWISPYAYCMNNPVMFIDPDGRDAMRTGSGTEDDPYVIKANYYYENGSLSKEQTKGLNQAVDNYNKLGGKNGVKVKNKDGSTSYVKFDLSAQGVDNVGAAVTGDIFTEVEGQAVSYGNAIGTLPNGAGGDEFGSANGWRVDINTNNIQDGITNAGHQAGSLINGTFIHEIGHNLGLDHDNNTNIMSNVSTTNTNNTIGGTTTTTHSYPSVDKRGLRILMNNVNTPRVGSMGIIRTR